MRCQMRARLVRCLLATVAAAVLAVGTVGCQKSTNDHLRAAKRAVLNEKPDQAQPHLDKVLEAQPDNLEAKSLMGQVDKLRGKYAEAEDQLRGLWDAQGFETGKSGDKAEELSTEQKSQKEMLADELTDLYETWAESLDPKEQPEKLVDVVKRGLEFDKQQPSLNAKLVTFYENRAKRLVEKGDKLEAAEAYENILDLFAARSKRKMARERSTNLRFEVNKKQMLAYFNEKAKAGLKRQDRYDAETNAIRFSVEQDVDEVEQWYEKTNGKEVRLDPRNKKHQPIIHQYTVKHKLKPALVDVVVEATGIPEDAEFSDVQPPEGFKVLGVEPTRRDYTIKAKIPVDAVLKIGFEIKEKLRKAKEDDDAAKKVAESDPKKDGAADDGKSKSADKE